MIVASSSKRIVARLLGAALFLVCTRSAAQQKPDVLVLKDGTRVEGTIQSRELGKSIVIALPDGTQRAYPWDALGEVELNGPPTAAEIEPPPAAAAPNPATAAAGAGPKPKKPRGEQRSAGAQVERDGSFSAGAERTCAEDDKACHEKLAVEGKGGDVKATYESEEDCAESDDERCTARTGASFDKEGLKIGYSRESAKAVKKPPHGATNLTLSLSGLGGFGENITMGGAQGALTVRILAGTRFPGEKGGSWFGAFIEPSVSMAYTSISITTPQQCFTIPGAGQQCSGGGTTTTSSGLAIFSGSVGIQWMHFGKMDPKTLKQGGFGLALGGLAGYALPTTQGAEGSFTYGPQIGFVFPRYNAGTASFSAFQINFFVLPTKDFTLVLGGVQFSFG